MSKEEDNKAVVGRWFAEFWGRPQLGSRGRPRRAGHADEVFAPRAAQGPRRHQGLHDRLPAAFPDLNFWGAADLIAEGDYVVGRWAGGGTHTGSAFGDFLAAGCRPRPAGRCTSPARRSSGGRRQDRRGNRPRRRRHRAAPSSALSAPPGAIGGSASLVPARSVHFPAAASLDACRRKRVAAGPDRAGDDAASSALSEGTIARNEVRHDGNDFDYPRPPFDRERTALGPPCRARSHRRRPLLVFGSPRRHLLPTVMPLGAPANPRNVQIHDTQAAAKATGFRPCRR